MRIWGVIYDPEDSDRVVTIGSIELRLAKAEHGWKMHLSGPTVAASILATGWHEIHSSTGMTGHLLPATPDLPVVLKPTSPIAVLPGTSAHYRVVLPLWIKIVFLSQSMRGTTNEPYADIPTRLVKRTWFGTGETGEIAYGWSFSPAAHYPLRRDEFCVPLTIKNGSQSTLWFERFLLRVIHLDLYETETGLQTNPVNVVFKGAEQFSQVTYGDGRIHKQRVEQRIGIRRQSSSSDIIRKSFLWLRDLAV